MDPSTSSPHPERNTNVMAHGVIVPNNDAVPTPSSSSNNIPDRTASQTQSPKSHVDQGPEEIGIQRFATAKEELDEDNTQDRPKSGDSNLSQTQSQTKPQPGDDPRRNMGRASMSTYSVASKQSIPPPGSVLTGKQEHCTLSHSNRPP